MISCILLSAGSSERFGSPKALAALNGKTVVEHLQEVILASRVSELIVVLGAHQDLIKPYLFNHRKVTFVYNKDHKLGQTSSFKAGLRVASDKSQGIMLLPVDFLFVQTETIDRLIEEFTSDRPLILIPVYRQKKGHPPLFNSVLRDPLLKRDDGQGLNLFERDYETGIRYLDVQDKGVIQTFNTPEEFEKLKANL
ncbi:MAG: nucleotidyltransferase family protein [Candidatus Omnitrophota bacterium]